MNGTCGREVGGADYTQKHKYPNGGADYIRGKMDISDWPFSK